MKRKHVIEEVTVDLILTLHRTLLQRIVICFLILFNFPIRLRDIKIPISNDKNVIEYENR